MQTAFTPSSGKRQPAKIKTHLEKKARFTKFYWLLCQLLCKEGNKMREERTILETIVFAYLVGECNWSPIRARAKVESMTYEELNDFVN